MKEHHHPNSHLNTDLNHREPKATMDSPAPINPAMDNEALVAAFRDGISPALASSWPGSVNAKALIKARDLTWTLLWPLLETAKGEPLTDGEKFYIQSTASDAASKIAASDAERRAAATAATSAGGRGLAPFMTPAPGRGRPPSSIANGSRGLPRDRSTRARGPRGGTTGPIQMPTWAGRSSAVLNPQFAVGTTITQVRSLKGVREGGRVARGPRALSERATGDQS